jgi:hypothetical protein
MGIDKNSMDKYFAPYQESFELKELGFNEPCLASYFHAGKRLDICEYINHGEYTVLAPTFSQAFRWFREKYKLVGIVKFGANDFTFNIYNSDGIGLLTKESLAFNGSYEEAELACLRKLIEIVKR